MKALYVTLGMLLAVSAIFMAGCRTGIDVTPSPVTPPVIPPSTTPATTDPEWAELRLKTAEATDFVGGLLSLATDTEAWLPPTPPAGGEPVRVLSEEEKAKVLEIAGGFASVLAIQSEPEVLDTDPRDYYWKSYDNPEAIKVSNRYVEVMGVSAKLDEYMGHRCYPGVFLLFHTPYDSYAYLTVNLTVSLAESRVVYVEAGMTAAQPPPVDFPNVNPQSYRLDFGNNLVNPLNPDYDPALKYGGEGTRFGPPWDFGGSRFPTGVTPTD